MNLSPSDHDRVAAAIRAAEQHTQGEIVCVLARASDSYFFPAVSVFAAAIFIVSPLVAFGLDRLWLAMPLLHFAAAQLAAFAAGLLVLWLAPGLRFQLVPRRVRYRRAHRNAVGQFLATNMHATEARTGVLLFVSLAERYAEVVADAGINARVPQAAWNGIVAGLLAHARDGRVADGFCAAVAEAGTLLAREFPRVSGDRNELPDRLVEI